MQNHEPPAHCVTQGDFGLAWRRQFSSNQALNCRFVQRGTGLGGSDADQEIRWFMNRDFRLALLRLSLGPLEHLHERYWRERDVTDTGSLARFGSRAGLRSIRRAVWEFIEVRFAGPSVARRIRGPAVNWVVLPQWACFG